MARRINLGKYQEKNDRVFAGRDRGAKVRAAEQLDQLDRTEEEVEIHVPEATFAVNSSFFLAMFGDSIRFLKEDRFRRKYRFTGKNISKTVESGIKDALHIGTPLQ